MSGVIARVASDVSRCTASCLLLAGVLRRLCGSAVVVDCDTRTRPVESALRGLASPGRPPLTACTPPHAEPSACRDGACKTRSKSPVSA
jgi:hypothetical protein